MAKKMLKCLSGNHPVTETLKDFFIPHKGNNYHPHSLHPKRIVFHLAGAVAVKIIAVSFVLFFPLGAWLAPDMAAQESEKIIVLTNDLRKAVNLAPLAENTKLDQAAYSKVQDMFLDQYFAHTSPTGKDLATWLNQVGYSYSMAGENLALGYSQADAVVSAWKASPAHYANISDANFEEIGVAMNDGRLNGGDTALIAQYFGRPAQSISATAKPTINKIKIDQAQAKLFLKGPAQSAEKVLNVETKLPEQTVSAAAIINGVKIDLSKNDQNGNWQGNTLIAKSEEKNLTNPTVPATLEIKDASGQNSYADLDWSEIQPIKTSAIDQYLLFKSNPSKNMLPVLGLSNLYLLILLILAIVASILNIFIEIKKQHPKVILNSLSLVALLVTLVIL
ncbi:MAG: CAP domain-containing protein [Patescibacteria group bacterium]|nr:CAP domain-containing protein [Patescibacteria group bacterium]